MSTIANIAADALVDVVAVEATIESLIGAVVGINIPEQQQQQGSTRRNETQENNENVEEIEEIEGVVEDEKTNNKQAERN
ncbi:unnamed protein product [Caenorhabditis bovis]|uniref:Uncharacterized protein n=1 Tax=Caenorhabditis bovis TaxID=2654633 RepID=A0A8S1FFF2_9PELO|nr:unnamed protein product [Caenorhabditis bovis]